MWFGDNQIALKLDGFKVDGAADSVEIVGFPQGVETGESRDGKGVPTGRGDGELMVIRVISKISNAQFLITAKGGVKHSKFNTFDQGAGVICIAGVITGFQKKRIAII